MTEPFPLAPMSRSIRVMTLVLLVLPVALLYLGVRAGTPWALLPGALVAAICVLVWLWFRPTRFEVAAEALRIVWPVRSEAIPLDDVEAVELATLDEFKARYGWGMRVGAGGLWGGFGLLVTKAGSLRFYVSRLDGLVLVHRKRGRTLLLSPATPEAFVSALQQRLSR